MELEVIEIKYDTPIEVSRGVYDIIMKKAGMTCAGIESENKFFIKLLHMAYKKDIIKILQSNKSVTNKSVIYK